MNAGPLTTQGILQPWGWETIIYYWLSSIATFTFITAFTYTLVRGENWAIKWGTRLAAPIAVLAGLSELIALGNIGAAPYTISRLSTPIAIDTISSVIFIITALIYAFTPKQLKPARNTIGWIAVIAALIWLIGRAGQFMLSAPARPFWGGLMPALILTTSIILGMATLSLIWALGGFAGRMEMPGEILKLNTIIASLILVLAFLLAFHVAGAAVGGETLAESAGVVASSSTFWAGVFLSIVIPVITYIAVYIFRNAISGKTIYSTFTLTSILIIVGILAILGILFQAGIRAPLPGEVLITP